MKTNTIKHVKNTLRESMKETGLFQAYKNQAFTDKKKKASKESCKNFKKYGYE